ncbi:MAG: hypothetical protein V4722_27205 [Bacteroidota bacterium]
MKIIVTVLSAVFGSWVMAQNVGIGTTSPINGRLEVINASGRGIKVTSQDGIWSDGTLTGVYATAGGFGIAGRFSNTGNGNALVTDAGIVKLNATSGNTGIGFSTTLGDNPVLGRFVVRGTIGAVSAMFGDNAAGVSIMNNVPSLGFNSYYNGSTKSIVTGYGAQMGLDQNTGRFFIVTSPTSVTGSGTAIALTERMTILPSGNIGVQGNDNPQSPLSFANLVGEKINFFDISASTNYGIGVQSSQMQLYTAGVGDAISFGYGSSAAFTEKVRMQNGYTVLYNGRLQFKGQLGGGNAQGIEFTDLAGINTKNFIGVFDDNNIGFFGFGGVGWGMMWDGSDGTLRLGTTQKAAGYLLNVGGKIMAEEVRVQLRAAWPDYVFNKNYNLKPLSEIENFIAANNHLPNVPAAAELEKSGIALGEMQSKMMEKIEELTLYILQLNKKVNEQAVEISGLKKQSRL